MKIFTHEKKVYIDDTDCGQCVYHANYLKFMEHARTEWLNTNGITHIALQEQGIFFVIRTAALKYMNTAKVNETLLIHTKASAIKKTRLLFNQSIAKKDNPGMICCEGSIEVVCVNRDTHPIKIPDTILALL